MLALPGSLNLPQKSLGELPELVRPWVHSHTDLIGIPPFDGRHRGSGPRASPRLLNEGAIGYVMEMTSAPSIWETCSWSELLIGAQRSVLGG